MNQFWAGLLNDVVITPFNRIFGICRIPNSWLGKLHDRLQLKDWEDFSGMDIHKLVAFCSAENSEADPVAKNLGCVLLARLASPVSVDYTIELHEYGSPEKFLLYTEIDENEVICHSEIINIEDEDHDEGCPYHKPKCGKLELLPE